jgi:hypothetical protein
MRGGGPWFSGGRRLGWPIDQTQSLPFFGVLLVLRFWYSPFGKFPRLVVFVIQIFVLQFFRPLVIRPLVICHSIICRAVIRRSVIRP